VTKADWNSPFIYTATERDNSMNTVSRLAILRFDTSAPGTELTATNAWDLTADLPAVGANLGLEAVTWIPDAYLVAHGFIDESTGATYDPSRYADHAGGLFFVGVEASGLIYGYALNHTTNAFQRVATVVSGHVNMMGLEFDRDVGDLWATCDNACGNRAAILTVGAAGRFELRHIYDHPTGLPDSNNEGLAIAPESECVGGFKNVYWSDDSNFGGHALRRGTIPCGTFF
jgi:hypothetical protein